MNFSKKMVLFICLSLCPCLFFQESVRADASAPSLYEQVLNTLEQLPREEAKIVVDIGVEEQRYQEEFKLSVSTLQVLREKGLPESVVDALSPLVNQQFTQNSFLQALEKAIGQELFTQYEVPLANAAYEGFAVFNFEEKVEIRFRVDKTSHVALMHIAERLYDKATSTYSGGEITFLLPNQKFADAQIQAEEVYSTLYNFEIDIMAVPPVADELVNIICSTEPLGFFDSTALQSDYYTITPDDDAALQMLLDGLQKLKQTEWGGSSLVLRIGGGKRALPKKFGAIPPMGATGTTGKAGKFFPPLGATGTTGKQ